LKELRLRRLFGKDQRSVIIAFDHAAFMGNIPGLEDPGKLLRTLTQTGVDSVITTIGVAKRFRSDFGSLGLILRVDGGSSAKSPKTGELAVTVTVEDAVRLGADAVICMGMIGFPEEPSSIQNLAALSAEADLWNIPLVAEMLVKGEQKEPTVEEIGFAMRVGVELGADLIKTSIALPVDRFQKVLQTCYRPVVILGGAKVDDEAALLTTVQQAVQAGAAGVAIGRNVWQHPNPAGMCRALVALVHGGASVSQALAEIKS
jgi:DhnA family fructose-bisphosphate aldolase class Ia